MRLKAGTKVVVMAGEKGSFIVRAGELGVVLESSPLGGITDPHSFVRFDDNYQNWYFDSTLIPVMGKGIKEEDFL